MEINLLFNGNQPVVNGNQPVVNEKHFMFKGINNPKHNNFVNINKNQLLPVTNESVIAPAEQAKNQLMIEKLLNNRTSLQL